MTTSSSSLQFTFVNYSKDIGFYIIHTGFSLCYTLYFFLYHIRFFLNTILLYAIFLIVCSIFFIYLTQFSLIYTRFSLIYNTRFSLCLQQASIKHCYGQIESTTNYEDKHEAGVTWRLWPSRQQQWVVSEYFKNFQGWSD